ncbi:purine-nucleoside phosphorylase, partial [Salmonella enterica subsp. enterica serovar Oslo]|nr:purine-nucleoside phosphorylase [Salmonella enterica subsp. enterica serovar Oslo]
MFYREDKSVVEKLMQHGVLGVEMETTALYTIAARFGVNALTILTVSDHLLTGEETSSEERQTTFNEMMEVALDTAISLYCLL